MRLFRRLALFPAAITLVLAVSGSAVNAGDARGQATKPRVILLIDSVGCADAFARHLCDGFARALRGTGVEGRIVTPTLREDLVDTLTLVAKQRYDLVIAFGFGYRTAMGVVAPSHRAVHFAVMDASLSEVTGRPRNVQGVVFRTSEAAYLAGWLAGRLEQQRAGPDVVGVVGGFKTPAVVDFVLGFRAGARRGSPGVTVLTDYSNNFVDSAVCKAIARRQIAKGAGVLFNVAGACGLGALEATAERGVWGIGVDADQSFLGPHILTSVLKRVDAGFLNLLRQVKSGKIVRGRDTVLTLRDDAVGLGTISAEVPAPLRAEIRRLERRIARGEILVPGAFPRGP